jgi:hypothetical protein
MYNKVSNADGINRILPVSKDDCSSAREQVTASKGKIETIISRGSLSSTYSPPNKTSQRRSRNERIMRVMTNLLFSLYEDPFLLALAMTKTATNIVVIIMNIARKTPILPPLSFWQKYNKKPLSASSERGLNVRFFFFL